MATLADVIRSKRKSGQSRTGSFFGSLKDKLKEKIDPRQIFNQTGILTSLFPSLKAYKAKGVGEETGKLIQRRTTELSNSPQSMGEGMDLSVVEKNTRISAVNSMALPGLSRDVNVMRQNISKLVKVVGLKPETKADNFFKKSSEREKEYESKFKTRPKLTGPNTTLSDEEEKSKGFLGSLLSIVGGLIKAVTTTIGKIFSTLFTLLQGLVTSLFTTLKVVLTTVITSLFGLFKTSIGKLLKSLGKVFSLMGAGGLATIIKAVISSKVVLAALALLVLAEFFRKRLLNKEKESFLFNELHRKKLSGEMNEDENKIYNELRAKGHKTKEERFMRESYAGQTGQKEFQDFVGVMRSQLSFKEGNRFYLNDKELYDKYGADSKTIDEWLRAGAVESLGEVEERLINPSMQADPVGEQISPGVQVNEVGKAYNKFLDGDLATKAKPFVDYTTSGVVTYAPRAPVTTTQENNSGSLLNSGFEEFQSLSDESVNTSVTNLTIPSESTPSTGGGGTRQPLPDTINHDLPDLPAYTGKAGAWT